VINPIKRPRRGRGTTIDMVVRAPVKTPEAPNPEIALPAMSADEVGATAEIKDPISNNKTQAMNSHFMLKKL
jgi:hypothetical protein